MDLYNDFMNLPGNINVIFDGTRKTRGHECHIGVGCIIKLYTCLVIDHKLLSNFCLGCTTGPKPDDEDFVEWQQTHKCQKNIDCKAWKSSKPRVCSVGPLLSRNYDTPLSDVDSRTFHALTEEEVYDYVNVHKKDCLNHVHTRIGAALHGLVEKKDLKGALGGRGMRKKMKKMTNYYVYALHKHDIIDRPDHCLGVLVWV